MKTKQPLGPQIDALLSQGLNSHVIAERLGCPLHYVSSIKRFGGWDARKKHMNANRWRWRRSTGSKRPDLIEKYAPIIAAVDSGLSYSQVAKKFGITRNAVAGIMNRRPEACT